jgi:hypothetical protein
MKRAKGGGGHRRTWSAAAATSTPVAPAVKSDDHVGERHPWSEVLLPSASEWREMEESSSVPHGGKVWTKTAPTTLTEAKGWGLGGGGEGLRRFGAPCGRVGEGPRPVTMAAGHRHRPESAGHERRAGGHPNKGRRGGCQVGSQQQCGAFLHRNFFRFEMDFK